MKTNTLPLSNREKVDYKSLAKALGIQAEELLSLDFHNENIFDEGGEIKEIKYVFSNDNPPDILSKIKGLDEQNAVILSTQDLNCNY